MAIIVVNGDQIAPLAALLVRLAHEEEIEIEQVTSEVMLHSIVVTQFAEEIGIEPIKHVITVKGGYGTLATYKESELEAL